MRRNKYQPYLVAVIFSLMFLFSACIDKQTIFPYDNNLTGTWKLTNTSSNYPVPVMTETTISFYQDKNEIVFENQNYSGVGNYIVISKGYGIKVNITRTDLVGGANSEWLDFFLANVNKTTNYQLYAEGYNILSTTKALTLTTSDSVKLYFRNQ